MESIVLRVQGLPEVIADFERSGLRLRNAMEEGPGGRQSSSRIPTAIRSSCSSPSASLRTGNGIAHQRDDLERHCTCHSADAQGVR